MLGKVDGILLDLGVSSPQLDDPSRGFSFLRSGPLDMRMDQRQDLTAAKWLADVDESTLTAVLRDYGEERFAKRIARAIVTERQQQVITTTKQLAEVIAKANPKWEANKHPATRSFQGIRIFINQELDAVKQVLAQCYRLLRVGGRLVIISFHSLEDRLVKRFVKQEMNGDPYPKKLAVTADRIKPKMSLIGRGIKASAREVEVNPRSRSAVLRVMEKLR